MSIPGGIVVEEYRDIETCGIERHPDAMRARFRFAGSPSNRARGTQPKHLIIPEFPTLDEGKRGFYLLFQRTIG